MINKFFGEYRFLSNFYPCKIVLDNIEFPSVEHAYVASKSLDENFRREVASIAKPGDVKKIGKKVKLREDWESVKLFIMEYLVRQKFSNDPLKTKLIYTYPRELIEGNTWGDTFWGQCNGVGQNHLGKILMKVREELIRGIP